MTSVCKTCHSDNCRRTNQCHVASPLTREEYTSLSPFLAELYDRKLIYQCTNINLLSALSKKTTITGYIGFDATADSLHVGHLSTIMMLRVLQQHGHNPIVLLGGGTTKIGDPTGRTELRKLLTDEDIEINICAIKNSLSNLLPQAIYADNSKWLDNMKYMTFLKNIGANLTINRMISFDYIKNRLHSNNPITFLEFNYPLLQAYDFLELHRSKDCILQMGGSDQWGNVVFGIDLAKKLCSNELIGLTCPLLLKPDGTKMGKTSSGAIWLSRDKTSIYDYWQYWRNVGDGEVFLFIERFTDILIDTSKTSDVDYINKSKEDLADAMTIFTHGQDSLVLVKEKLRANLIPMDQMNKVVLEEICDLKLSLEELLNSTVTKILVSTGLSSGNTEAHNLLKSSAIHINESLVTRNRSFSAKDIVNNVVRIQKGKKKIFTILIQNTPVK